MKKEHFGWNSGLLRKINKIKTPRELAEFDVQRFSGITIALFICLIPLFVFKC